jgi:acyl dehydratase
MATTDEFNGRLVESWPMDDEMGPALVRLWCEVLEDPNPIYWDADFAARSSLGGLIAPPPMLMPLTTRAEWTPDGPRTGMKDELAKGLPGHPYASILRMVQTYHRPMRMGERPTIEFHQAEPTAEIDTERGRGRIVAQRFAFRDIDGADIAELRLDQLRYRDRGQLEGPARAAWDGPVARPLARYETRRWSDVVEGELTAPISLEITLKRCIKWVAATRDFYEVHHDPAYAKASGDPDLFIGVHFAHGLIGRLGTDWGGAEAQLRRMDFRTFGRVYLDEVLTVRGRVVRRYERDADRLVDLDVESATGSGVIHTATLTVALPD